MTDSTTTPALDLEAIEAREKAASPAPWSWKGSEMSGGRQLEGEWWGAEMSPVLVPYVCKSCAEDPKRICLGPNEADSAFITHARTDIPAMAAEIRSLREEVAKLKARLADVDGLLEPAEVDIGEWCRFAQYQRDMVPNPGNYPSLATAGAIEKSRALQRRIQEVAYRMPAPGANPKKGEG